MATIKEKLYNDLRKVYNEAHLNNKDFVQKRSDLAKKWKDLKESPSYPGNVKDEIKRLERVINDKKRPFDRYWVNSFAKMAQTPSSAAGVDIATCQNNQNTDSPRQSVRTASNPSNPEEASSATGVDIATCQNNQNTDLPRQNVRATFNPFNPEEVSTTSNRNFKRPAEESLEKEINSLNHDIVYLMEKRRRGEADQDQLKELKKKAEQLQKIKGSLKALANARKRQQRHRLKLKKVIAENPEIAAKLHKRSTVGAPRLEDVQPGLLEAIGQIASFGGGTHERRRSEEIRSVKTLTDLQKALDELGYQLSRSALYLRLLPKRYNTTEGKRHVKCVPVKLMRARNDAHKFHTDTQFCKATINYLEEMASYLGPSQVLFISQDDKARVPIGMTAANKQSPMLMHLEYRVKLPDHDWVVANRHKLIPSVYALMEVKENMTGDLHAVTYSGPTFIKIRSGKHSSSNASSHGKDLDELLTDEDFYVITCDGNGMVKPVIIIKVDGGPDENPRYEKVINEAIQTFRKYDLDAIFIATNAPGRSAYNRVERRMAPLSRELCGLILKHDHYGSHLDDQGRTTNPSLEKQNFQHAGETLAQIWSTMVFDGFPTKASYVKPEESERSAHTATSTEWKNAHIRESHYCLQITRCDNRACCTDARGNYRKLFPRFLPAPLCVDQRTQNATNNSDEPNKFTSLLHRLRLNDDEFRQKNGEVPYDITCPSIKDAVPARTCNLCGMYFAAIKSVKNHQKSCREHSALNEVSRFGQSLWMVSANRRPVRVAAQRQREKMILWFGGNDKHADWVDEEDLENIALEEDLSKNSNKKI